MGSTIILFALIILAILLLRWNKRRKEYNARFPIRKAYRDWVKALTDSDKVTAAIALNQHVFAELTKETDTQGLKRRYHGLIYWDADTEKYGKDVIDFYNVRHAELKTAERAESERLQARQKREEEALEAAYLQHAQEATTAKEAGIVYCNTPGNGPAEKLALEKWDRFSLLDILNAKTVGELQKAEEELREGSIGAKLAPFMHDRLARFEASAADTVEAIIAAGENAPDEIVPGDTALRIVFEKLYDRRNTITTTM